jgi:hypothetical protein
MSKQSDSIAEEVLVELDRACATFKPFNSAYEGLAILHEEFIELQTEVYKRDKDVSAMRKEATQVAAMAMRFIKDVCA